MQSVISTLSVGSGSLRCSLIAALSIRIGMGDALMLILSQAGHAPHQLRAASHTA